jgi:hypothetical protein
MLISQTKRGFKVNVFNDIHNITLFKFVKRYANINFIYIRILLDALILNIGH